MKAAQIRIARPTDKLKELIQFYQQGLGLNIIGSFEGHDGYDGVMLGMPDASIHLEFTQHVNGSPCPAPTRDNLLVFYFETNEAYQAAVNQLKQEGAKEVEPENGYWIGKSTSFEDPDGWGVVLFNGLFAAN
ncbi:MAG TPA: VOC family protein [Ferruginibacter sp.]|nr:VOC family protein [Ferruginibacter sp.]